MIFPKSKPFFTVCLQVSTKSFVIIPEFTLIPFPFRILQHVCIFLCVSKRSVHSATTYPFQGTLMEHQRFYSP